MAVALRSRSLPVEAELQRLREQLDRVQRRRADSTALPVADALSSLFPDGGLRPGATYTVPPSTSLLLALLSAPSEAGSWCAVVGMPALGAEAAAAYGVALERLVLVPDPGQRWLAVTAALAEVVPLIAVQPQSRVADGDIARLSARLRDRGGVLLVSGSWPQADAGLDLHDPQWEGTGAGYGMLHARTVTVSATGRRSPVPRRVRVQLPGAAGAVVAAPAVRRGHLTAVPA